MEPLDKFFSARLAESLLDSSGAEIPAEQADEAIKNAEGELVGE